MKVELVKQGIRVEPETDFEARYLEAAFSEGKFNCFLKYGVDLTQLLGLQVTIEKKED